MQYQIVVTTAAPLPPGVPIPAGVLHPQQAEGQLNAHGTQGFRVAFTTASTALVAGGTPGTPREIPVIVYTLEHV